MLPVLVENISLVPGTSTRFRIEKKLILTLVKGLVLVLVVCFLTKQIAEPDTGFVWQMRAWGWFCG